MAFTIVARDGPAAFGQRHGKIAAAYGASTETSAKLVDGLAVARDDGGPDQVEEGDGGLLSTPPCGIAGSLDTEVFPAGDVNVDKPYEFAADLNGAP